MTKKRIKADPLDWMDKRTSGKVPAKKALPAKPARPAIQAEPARIKMTFRIKPRHAELLKAQSYWARTNQRELLDSILEAHFKGKRIKPIKK